MKENILKESRLVFTTLSIEISNLMPLAYGCKRLILIGDHKQLPATLFRPQVIGRHYTKIC